MRAGNESRFGVAPKLRVKNSVTLQAWEWGNIWEIRAGGSFSSHPVWTDPRIQFGILMIPVAPIRAPSLDLPAGGDFPGWVCALAFIPLLGNQQQALQQAAKKAKWGKQSLIRTM